MSYRRRETTEARLDDTLSKTEKLTAVSRRGDEVEF